MCGFIGVLSADPSHREPSIIDTMHQCITHRGPDDSGVYTSGPLALGFRRLSVIDLEAGHQPMQTANGRYAIVFNGEIYNFQELRTALQESHHCHFTTRSDTEVILQAYAQWGPDTFHRLNGMFAIAIWDNQEQQLTLARDRAGKKPLFYHCTAGTLILASEIKSLLRHPVCKPKPDLDRLVASLAYRYVPRHENLFEDICAVPPGHWTTISLDTLTTVESAFQPYYVPEVPFLPSVPSKSASAHVDHLTRLLTNSIHRRLIADVPVGAFLSGGVDSSLIVALMSRQVGSALSTFSIGFDTGVSEHEQARFVARQFDTTHHETIIKAEHLLDEIPAVLWHRESPISEPSDIPLYILAREASRHVTVVLSGEGSDELFAGYPKYVAEYYLSKYGAAVPRPLIRASTHLPGLNSSSSPAALAAASLSERNSFDGMARWFGAFGPRELTRLLSPDLQSHITGTHQYAQEIAARYPAASHLTRLQLQDYHHWLPANLLLRGDRVTMAHSLELRCPFLDPEIIDFAFTQLPDKLKIRRGTSKWIVRKVADELLPPAISQRKKWGFKVPVAQWFRGPLKQPLVETLLSPTAHARGYFNHKEIERLITEHLNGTNHSKQLWYLYQLELWHQMFIDQTLQANHELKS